MSYAHPASGLEGLTWNDVAQREPNTSLPPDGSDLSDLGYFLEDPATVAPVVPGEVPMWKAKSLMVVMGLYGAVRAAIEALPEPQRTLAFIQFDSAPNLRRDAVFVEMFGPQLGLTDEQIDQLFIQADLLQ